MEIFVNKTPINVANFDDEEIILAKYALELDNALPQYFYVRTKDFVLKQGARLKVRDIRTTLENLPPQQFFDDLEDIKERYNGMSKYDITLLFLSQYSSAILKETVRGDAVFMKNLMNIDTRFFYAGAVVERVNEYQTEVERKRKKLVEMLYTRNRINKILRKEPKLDAQPFELEAVSFEIPVELANDNTLLGIFDMIKTSKEVPYVVLLYQDQKWAKTYRHVPPLNSWIEKTKNISLDDPDGIRFWVLNSLIAQLPRAKYTSNFYSMGTWNLENKIEICVDVAKKEAQKDIIKNNLLSSLDDRIDYKLLPEKQVKIKGTFIVSDIIFNRMVFSDMIMNNQTVAYFFFMGERFQSVSRKKRYWIYYSPNQTGDINNSLTITITPESNETLGYSIEVRISKAKTTQEVNSFINVFSSILGLYKRKQNDVIDDYAKILGKAEAKRMFAESVKGQTEKKIDKKTGKRLRELKMTNPDMIRSNYTCQKGRQPYFVPTKEEAREIKKSLGKFGKYKVMQYPYKKGGYFACQPREPGEEDKTYPGLIRNKDDATKTEYPLVPCCWKNNQYIKESKNAVASKLMLYLSNAEELEDSGMTNLHKIHLEASRAALEEKKVGSKEFLRPLDSKKILDRGRYGIIPYYVKEIANRAGYKNIQYYDKSTPPLLTYGVLHEPDSFIHCLERAFNDDYETLDRKEKLKRVKNIRKAWANMNFSIAKQELYDYSQKDIVKFLKTEENYIDPSMFVSLASEYYKCNIFLYEINNKHPHGCVVIPRFSQAYLLKDISEVQRTVFIIRRAVKNYTYPYQCEIMVEIEESNKKKFNPVFEDSSLIQEATKVLNSSNSVYIVTTEGSFYYIPVSNDSRLFRKAKSQLIDNNGKMRGLNYKSGVTLMISPLPPLSIPTVNTTFSVSRNEAEAFINEKNLEISSQDGDEEENLIQGLWVVSKIQNSGLYYGYIPIEQSQAFSGIKFSSPITEDPIGSKEVSELATMKKNKKIASLLQAYTLYEYSKLDDKKEIDDLFDIDEDHEYDIRTLGEIIEPDNPVIYSGGRIIVPSEDVMNRLKFYVKNQLINDSVMVESYKNSKIIRNYYTSLDDFKKRPGELVFGSPELYKGPEIESSIERWKHETSRNIRNGTVSSNWITLNRSRPSEWNYLKPEPYFFRNSTVESGNMAIVQNVETGELDQALYVAVKWVKEKGDDRVNVGFSPPSSTSEMTEEIEDRAYAIYYENGGKMKKVKGEGKRAYVVEYNDGNYAAILFL
uniref:Early transcription factor large subunit-like protein n=1 Tax=Marseillevirus LCMAC101 TaxID=2506602 RepID=A0A481YQW8_9VIRU|nr:MAG: early transcription factor large subunit-like protein [Marseillevirus LCMAC101]